MTCPPQHLLMVSRMFVPRSLFERIIPNSGLKMLFIHTPKCGGSMVGHAFGRHFRRCVSVRHAKLKGHLTWVEYRDRLLEIGQPISDFKTFSVVRNPFEWHFSWFNYLQHQKPHRTGYYIEHEMFQSFSFSDYVSWLDDAEAPRTPRHDMGKQLADWVCDENGEVVITEILRQERLSSDLTALKDRYRLKINVPKTQVNAFSRGKDFRSYYSDNDISAIAKRHQRDLELFGYAFE